MENKKYRNFEIILYPENDDHIKILLDIKKRFKYAYILHDKDKKDDGIIKKHHWHMLVFLDNQKTLSAFGKMFHLQDSMNLIEIVKDKKKAIRYLVHVDNDEKEKYDINDIQTNIDISSYFSNLVSNESIEVDDMIAYVTSYQGYLKYEIFFAYIRGNNLWSTYRRNQYAFNKLVDEHNKEATDELLAIFRD